MTFKAFIFDMDGVLIDSEPLSMQALTAAADALAYRIPPEAMDRYPGQAAHMVFADVAQYGDGRFHIDQLHTLYDAIYSAWLPYVSTIPGALDLYALARDSGKPVGLATSTGRTWAMSVVEKLGLTFDATVCQEDVAHNKPAPDAYLNAAAGLGVDPADCLVFEDSLSGVAAGVAAGCTVWAYDGSFPRERLAERGAHRIFSRHADIIEALK